jgi:DNA-binding GntR family transcriptional regulator
MTDSGGTIVEEQEEEAPKVAGMNRRRALSPIPRETLHDRVYGELRRSLIHGVFATGETLRIQELAAKLQTSTMPVREALARLVSEQALEALPNRSVRVPVITRERLEDLARARTMIEGQIVALALPNLTASDFAHLRQLAGQCEAAFRSQDGDRARITSELNHAFHYYIYRAARSPVLIPIVESLWLQSGPYVQAAAILHEELRDLPGAHHHWALIKAMERGDQAGAIEALTDDVSRSFNLVRQRLDAEDAEKKAANDG